MIEDRLMLQAKIETRGMDEDGLMTVPTYKWQLSNIKTGQHVLLSVGKDVFDNIPVESVIVMRTERTYHLGMDDDYVTINTLDGVRFEG